MIHTGVNGHLSRLWDCLMPRLGISSSHEAMRDWLLMSWSEPHRHHHDSTHLLDCIKMITESGATGRVHATASLALWFHDCVYDPRKERNEELCLVHAKDFARMAGLPAQMQANVADAVKATFHTGPPPRRPAAKLAHDADLSVLGMSKARYAKYAEGIWQEWKGVVARECFCRGRADIFRTFLGRKAIYLTPWFHERFEAAARRNLAAEIRSLERQPRKKENYYGDD